MKREFTTPVTMVCSDEQYENELFRELSLMGIGVISVENKQRDFIEAQSGYCYCPMTLIGNQDAYLIGEYNPSLFLAVAAMSRGRSFYLGEYVRIDKNKDLFKVQDIDNVGNVTLIKDEKSNYKIPFNYLVKASREEIIDWFSGEKKYLEMWGDLQKIEDPLKVEVKFSFEDKSRDYNVHINRESNSRNIDLIKKLVDATGVLGPKGSADISIGDVKFVTGSIKPEGKFTFREPPIGIMPRKLWEEQRITDLVQAVIRYVSITKDIPEEWVDELNNLLWDRTDHNTAQSNEVKGVESEIEKVKL